LKFKVKLVLVGPKNNKISLNLTVRCSCWNLKCIDDVLWL